MANQACYRKLKKYKYQLVDRDYEISIEIEERDIDTDYIALGPDGRLIESSPFLVETLYGS